MKRISKIFAVVAAVLLAGPAFGATPEGKSLHYIMGNSPIRITGFAPPSDGRIEMKVENNSASMIVCYFCARSTGKSAADRLSFGVFSDSNQWHFHYNKTIFQVADSSDKTGRQLILSASAKGGIVVNGVQVPNSAVDEADFVPGGDLVLLAAQEAISGNGYANQFDYVFYWTKVYDMEDNLIASFVPWLGKTANGDDVPGVLDEKTGNFYPPVDPAAVQGREEQGHRLSWCATAGAGAIIDTGFVPPSRGRVEAKFALTSEMSDNSAYVPFGACKRESDVALRQSFRPVIRKSAVDFYYNQANHSGLAAPMFRISQEMTMSVSGKDGILINGQLVEGSNVGAADFTVGGSLVIFGSQNPLSSSGYSGTADMRFYWLKVYDEADNLIASYVPWIDDFGNVGVCHEQTGLFIKPLNRPLHAGRTISAEVTGAQTATVKVSAMPNGVPVLLSDLYLWPVCDAEDKGENLAAWTYKGRPVQITGEACEVEVEFPNQYMGANRFGRIILAAPVLTATGSQYAELNRPLTDADGVEIVFSFNNVQQSMIFGSRSDASSQNISALLNKGAACIDFCNDGNYSKYRQTPNLASVNIYQIVDDKYRRATTNLTTGAKVSTPNMTEYNGAAFSQLGNCRIFGASAGAPSGYGNFVGSIYSFRVYESATGKTLYNLLPGKNANGEPCFVDTLTGDFYENKGAGRFILDESAVSTSVVMPPLKRQGLIIFIN